MDDRVREVEKAQERTDREVLMIANTQKNMSDNLGKIAVTLNQLLELHLSTKLLSQELVSLKASYRDSRKRCFDEIEKSKKEVEIDIKAVSANLSRVAWLVITAVVVGLMSQILKT